MKTEHKIYATIALASVAVIGVGVGGALARRSRAGAHEVPAAPQGQEERSAALPRIALPEDVAGAITKIELTQARQDDRVDDESSARTITLERQVSGWELTSPLRSRASASKVAALVDNLKGLTLEEAIDRGAGRYDAYRLTDAQGLHVVARRGNAVVTDLYFGQSIARGQLVRVAGTDGVFLVANTGPRGYSGFLYTRSVRSWRETAIFAFAEGDVAAVEVTNASGRLSFSRDRGSWSGSRARRDPDGTLREREAGWPKLDPGKVDDLVRAYRALAADDFGVETQRAGSGVDDAEHMGGVIRIRLAGGEEHAIRVGNLSTNTGRWAIPGSRWAVEEGGDGTLYALAPWTTNWALAGERTFER
jgi:Domain of unknown function (DUF4340)